MLSKFGKFIRRLRIDEDLILKDVADMLEVSSSMLSAVENGKKAVPLEWEDKITKAYNLSEIQQQELHDSILDSLKQIKLQINNGDYNRAKMAVSFARNFDHLDEEKIKQIFEILENDED